MIEARNLMKTPYPRSLNPASPGTLEQLSPALDAQRSRHTSDSQAGMPAFEPAMERANDEPSYRLAVPQKRPSLHLSLPLGQTHYESYLITHSLMNCLMNEYKRQPPKQGEKIISFITN